MIIYSEHLQNVIYGGRGEFNPFIPDVLNDHHNQGRA